MHNNCGEKKPLEHRINELEGLPGPSCASSPSPPLHGDVSIRSRFTGTRGTPKHGPSHPSCWPRIVSTTNYRLSTDQEGQGLVSCTFLWHGK